MSSIYALDITGINPVNKVTAEQQTLTAANYKDFAFLIPEFAPFYGASLQVSFKDLSNNIRPMVEGVDYLLGMEFIGASRATALPIYGAIQFLDLTLNGTVIFNQYQTLGGDYVLDSGTLTALMTNLLYNPRISSWEQVTGLPDDFPPQPHQWDLIDLVGMKDTVGKLEGIVQAILKSINNGQNEHFTDYDNPHQTDKALVGLDVVENYPPATTSQCIAGTDPAAYVTPLGLGAAMSAAIGTLSATLASISTHLTSNDVDLSGIHSSLTSLSTGIGTLSSSVSGKITSLSTVVSSSVASLQSTDATLSTAISTANVNISANATSITNVYNSQVAADGSLQGQINGINNQRNIDVTNLSNTDNSLQGQINSHSGSIGSINNFLLLSNLIPTIFNNVDCVTLTAALTRCGLFGGGVSGGPGPMMV